jgi:hypothetical protein
MGMSRDPAHLFSHINDGGLAPTRRCGCKAEPLANRDDCSNCALDQYLAYPDELDEDMADARLQSPEELAVYARARAVLASGIACSFCDRPAEQYGTHSHCCHAPTKRCVSDARLLVVSHYRAVASEAMAAAMGEA